MAPNLLGGLFKRWRRRRLRLCRAIRKQERIQYRSRASTNLSDPLKPPAGKSNELQYAMQRYVAFCDASGGTDNKRGLLVAALRTLVAIHLGSLAVGTKRFDGADSARMFPNQASIKCLRLVEG